jgi:hypothetical protein
VLPDCVIFWPSFLHAAPAEIGAADAGEIDTESTAVNAKTMARFMERA